MYHGVGRKCDVLTSGRASARKHYATMLGKICVQFFSSFSSARAMCFYHFNHFGVQLCSRLWFITVCSILLYGRVGRQAKISNACAHKAFSFLREKWLSSFAVLSDMCREQHVCRSLRTHMCAPLFICLPLAMTKGCVLPMDIIPVDC